MKVNLESSKLGMIAESDILCFIDALYAAAWGRQDREAALGSLAALFHASRVCAFDAVVGEAGAVTTVRDVAASIDDPEMGTRDFVEAFTQPGGPQHPYLSFFAGHGPAVARLEEVVDIGKFRRGPIWNEWMKPRDLDLDLRGFVDVDPADGAREAICIHRASHQGPFSDREKELFVTLLPHLTRAGSIADLLRRHTLDAALAGDRDAAILVVDKACRVVRANAPADAILSSPDEPLRLRNGALVFRTPSEGKKLACLVAEALLPPLAGQAGAVAIFDDPVHTRPRHRLVISAGRIPPGEIPNAPNDLVLLSIRQVGLPAGNGLMPILRRLFGLPPAQARLAMRLAGGETLREAATACGISYNSARIYLASIYACTGTNHQGELVALLKTVEKAAPG